MQIKFKKPISLEKLTEIVRRLKIKPKYDQTFCGCGEGWMDERCCGKATDCIFDYVSLINKPVTTTKELPIRSGNYGPHRVVCINPEKCKNLTKGKVYYGKLLKKAPTSYLETSNFYMADFVVIYDNNGYVKSLKAERFRQGIFGD
jgi:hypothetical protein